MADVTVNILLLLHPETGKPEALLVSPIRWPAESELAKLTPSRGFEHHDVVIALVLHAIHWEKMRTRLREEVLPAYRESTPYITGLQTFSWIGDLT
jgi:hypothetical protein